MLGNNRLDAQCIDGVKRLAHIRGKMRKKVWVNAGDVVLVGLRDYQDGKADVILKYSAEEARALKSYGELPESLRINEATEALGGGEVGEKGFFFFFFRQRKKNSRFSNFFSLNTHQQRRRPAPATTSSTSRTWRTSREQRGERERERERVGGPFCFPFFCSARERERKEREPAFFSCFLYSPFLVKSNQIKIQQ